jgi:hypothetical protein
MLYHTANPASTDGEVSPKADRVLANSSISQKYPAKLKTNTGLLVAKRRPRSRLEKSERFLRLLSWKFLWNFSGFEFSTGKFLRGRTLESHNRGFVGGRQLCRKEDIFISNKEIIVGCS